MSAAVPIDAAALEQHRRRLWGLCYRMTGSAADADDLVQETFARALQSAPEQRDGLGAWLTTVALNLSRDALRRRRRRGYVGPWLPSPVETGADPESMCEPVAAESASTAGRYELLESVSMAFLIALEALTPTQRAVLLLRDVFDHSVHETASALGMSEGNVKTTLHRARAAMQAYDTNRQAPSPALTERTREVLGRAMAALAMRDYDTLETLLDEECVAFSDGGGEFFAARKPLLGRQRVLHFHRGLVEKGHAMLSRAEVRELNGLPALLAEIAEHREGDAPRFVNQIELGPKGTIVRWYSVLASKKLSGLRWG